jgi:hypothetical protein
MANCWGGSGGRIWRGKVRGFSPGTGSDGPRK